MGLRTLAQPAISEQKGLTRRAITSRRTRSIRMNTSMFAPSFSAKLWVFLIFISSRYSMVS